MGRPELSTTQAPAPPKTAESVPTATRPHNEDPASIAVQQHDPQRLATMAQIQLPQHRLRVKFLHLSPQILQQRNKPCPASPCLLQSPGPKFACHYQQVLQYWLKSSNSNIYMFLAKFWHEYHNQTHESAGLPWSWNPSPSLETTLPATNQSRALQLLSSTYCFYYTEYFL